MAVEAYARNVSGATGNRVTGGVDCVDAGSAACAFAAGAACLRWTLLAATAEKAGASRNAIANIVSFFM
jgi:hypothetical protein